MSYTSFSITKLQCAKIKHSDWLKEVECEFEHSVKKIYFSIKSTRPFKPNERDFSIIDLQL